jgi:hypothetical protein
MWHIVAYVRTSLHLWQTFSCFFQAKSFSLSVRNQNSRLGTPIPDRLSIEDRIWGTSKERNYGRLPKEQKGHNLPTEVTHLFESQKPEVKADKRLEACYWYE